MSQTNLLCMQTFADQQSELLLATAAKSFVFIPPWFNIHLVTHLRVGSPVLPEKKPTAGMSSASGPRHFDFPAFWFAAEIRD